MREARTKIDEESLAGSLLLAHPVLRDRHFRRTAILMSNHDQEGAMGLVLNRPLHRTLGEFGGDFAYGPLALVPVFDGGPVEKTQIILCAWRPQNGPEAEGLQVFFGLDRERAAELAEQTGVEVRAFLGYAGWSSGQLEGELACDTWVVASLEPDSMRHAPDERMWKVLLGRLDPQWVVLAGEPDELGAN